MSQAWSHAFLDLRHNTEHVDLVVSGAGRLQENRIRYHVVVVSSLIHSLRRLVVCILICLNVTAWSAVGEFMCASHWDFSEFSLHLISWCCCFIFNTRLLNCYRKAIDHKFLWFRGMINHLGCWKNTRRIRILLVFYQHPAWFLFSGTAESNLPRLRWNKTQVRSFALP